MKFLSLAVFQFRNLSSEKIDLDGKNIFLIGENGQGKSNFLEALYFCSYGSSFRGSSDKEIPLKDKKECSLFAVLDSGLNDTIQIKITNSKKLILINGKNVNDRKELLSLVPTIIFCHEDMDLVTGAPEVRRTFFDQNLCLYDFDYLENLRKYKKTLKSRNLLLKELKEKKTAYSASCALLEVLDPQLAGYGCKVTEKRLLEIKKFSKIFSPLYKMVSGIENIDVEYNPSWRENDIQTIMLNLKEKREQEIFMGNTVSGPHRDNYTFTQSKEDFSKKASTGQKRLIALLLRAAQANMFYERNAKKPVLLLDDVLLELDGEKKVKFLATLPEYEQAFYTFLPEEPYYKYQKEEIIVYKVQNGVFCKQ